MACSNARTCPQDLPEKSSNESIGREHQESSGRQADLQLNQAWECALDTPICSGLRSSEPGREIIAISGPHYLRL